MAQPTITHTAKKPTNSHSAVIVVNGQPPSALLWRASTQIAELSALPCYVFSVVLTVLAG